MREIIVKNSLSFGSEICFHHVIGSNKKGTMMMLSVEIYSPFL